MSETSSTRMAIRVVAMVLLAGLLGWQFYHYQHRRPQGIGGTGHAQQPAAPAASGSVAVAPPTSPEQAAPVPVASGPDGHWRLGRLDLQRCELKQPNSALSSAAWCGKVEVPENRAEPHGRQILLNLAVVRSSAQLASADMVTLLAGGPGQAATDSWTQLSHALQGLLAHRHVLLLDQRGTGDSNPLSCKDGDPGDDSGNDAPAQMRRQAQACLKQIQTHADPRYYTTTDAVADLEQVRQLLGSPRLDLIGVSYGTRVAQQYAMAHPAAVRTVLLDGVVPNSLVLGEDFARNLDDALKALFAHCTAEPACRQRFGDPYQTLYQLRDALRANPHEVSFRDPETYQSVKRVLDDNALVSVVRLFAYNPLTAALLPLSIDNAAHGDVGPLLGQAKLLNGDLADNLNSGMQYSVICSEDADLLTERPQDAQTLLGNRMVETFRAICPVWPRGRRPADFHRPWQSALPTLLLSGQYDPVTPPRYGEEVARGLSDARHFVLRGQGHNVIATGCMPDLVKDFIEQGSPQALDGSCLNRLQPTPPFIDFNGATP